MKNIILLVLFVSHAAMAGLTSPVESGILRSTGEAANQTLITDGTGGFVLSTITPFTGAALSSPTTGVTVTGGTGAVNGAGTTISVATAGVGQPGLVSTGTQTLPGAKTFSSSVDVTNGEMKKNGVKYIHSPGTNNMITGEGSGVALSSGVENACHGALTCVSQTTGSRVSSFGYGSGYLNVGGNDNVNAGWLAGFGGTSASRMVNLGAGAGASAVTTSDTINIGWNSGQNATGGKTIAIGSSAGAANTTNGLTAVGFESGNAHTSGIRDSYYGYQSGRGATTATDQSFFGDSAGKVSNGSFTSMFGSLSGQNATTSSLTSLFGYASGISITTGTGNNCYGANSCFTLQTGDSNAVYGTSAGNLLTSSRNNLFGNSAGEFISTGGNNLCAGTQACQATTTGSGNIALGDNVQLSSPTASNELAIGNWLSGTAATLSLKTAGTARWDISSLSIRPVANNTYDIGTTGLRVKKIYSMSQNVEILGVGAPGVNFIPNYELDIRGAAGNATMQLSNTASGSASTDGALIEHDGANFSITNQEPGDMTLTNSVGDSVRMDEVNTRIDTTMDIISTRNRIDILRVPDEEIGFYLANNTASLSGALRIMPTDGQLELFSSSGHGVLLNGNGGPINTSGGAVVMNINAGAGQYAVVAGGAGTSVIQMYNDTSGTTGGDGILTEFDGLDVNTYNLETGGKIGWNTVDAGLDIGTTGTKPTCDATVRGQVFFEEGATLVADVLYQCMKDSTDAYAWEVVHAAP